MELKVLLITQARMGSTRFPGKILKKIDGKSLLQIHTDRLLKAKMVDRILIATTTLDQDEHIYDWAIQNDFLSYRGSETDVLDRFYKAAINYNPEWIVRVTSDCPLHDPELVDYVINMAIENNVDYCSNVLKETFPDGQDVEVFSFKTLEETWKLAKLTSEREHVTSFIRTNLYGKGSSLFSSFSVEYKEDLSKIRMTVDEEKDFILIGKLIQKIGFNATWLEYVNCIRENNFEVINSDIIRNEGYIKSIKNDKIIG